MGFGTLETGFFSKLRAPYEKSKEPHGQTWHQTGSLGLETLETGIFARNGAFYAKQDRGPFGESEVKLSVPLSCTGVKI